MENPTEVIFQGIKYKLMGSGKYYLSQSNTNAGRRKAKGLHVAIYENYHGITVPKGFCVHHKDHNSFNNDIENLELIKTSEHASTHGKERWGQQEFQTKQLLHLENIRDLTKEWHSSEEGLKWHSEHAKNSIMKAHTEEWKTNHTIKKNCEECGNEFETWLKRRIYCGKKCNCRAFARKRKEKKSV